MRSFDFDDIEAVEFIDNDEDFDEELEEFIAHHGTLMKVIHLTLVAILGVVARMLIRDMAASQLKLMK